MPLTPDQIAAPGNEHAHQAAVFQAAVRLGRHYPDVPLSRLFAVPNGADYGGNAATGARMRAEGLKRGVPDMMWPWGPERDAYWVDNCGWTYPMKGLWVELKRPGAHTRKDGDRKPEQVEWQQWLRAQGWSVVTAYGWKCAVWAILEHIDKKLKMVDGDALLVHTVDTTQLEEMVS